MVIKKTTTRKTAVKKTATKKTATKKTSTSAARKNAIRKNATRRILGRKPIEPVKKQKPLPRLNKEDNSHLPKIKVVGVGGSGINAVQYMIDSNVDNVDFIVINTDVQDLEGSDAPEKIYIGKNTTQGIGSGMNPEVGKRAAEEERDEIKESLEGAQMVFLTGGMGGGTGTGASPVIANIAKELGILTVAVITKPFSFEGSKRRQLAEEGIRNLSSNVDAYIVIENDKIFEASGEDATMEDAFALSDEVLRQAVEGISDLIVSPGRINIDYADIKTVLENSGLSLIGIGSAVGEDRAEEAATAAISSPLIDISTDGSRSVLFSISANDDLRITEISKIADTITREVDPSAMIKFGTVTGSDLEDGEIRVTVVASKFIQEEEMEEEEEEIDSNQNNFGIDMSKYNQNHSRNNEYERNEYDYESRPSQSNYPNRDNNQYNSNQGSNFRTYENDQYNNDHRYNNEPEEKKGDSFKDVLDSFPSFFKRKD